MPQAIETGALELPSTGTVTMAAEGLQGDAVLDSLQPFVMLHDLEEVHQYLLGRAQFNLELCGFERERLPFYGPVGEPVIRC
jgi:hypothetical protein